MIYMPITDFHKETHYTLGKYIGYRKNIDNYSFLFLGFEKNLAANISEIRILDKGHIFLLETCYLFKYIKNEGYKIEKIIGKKPYSSDQLEIIDHIFDFKFESKEV